MSLWGDLSRKLGFTAGDDDREEELEDSELSEEEEEEDYPEEDEARDAFQFPNPFRKRPSTKNRVQADYDEDSAPVNSQRGGTVIHDPRIESRGVSGSQAVSPYTHCERIIEVRQVNDCRNIIKFLLEGESVMLNLENIEPKDCTRVVDLLSGAAFALQGRLVKIAHLSYLLAPQNVEVIDLSAGVTDRARYR